MVNLFSCLFLAALTLLSSTAHAQPVSASVDRNELVRGETITLTLRIEGQQGGVEMDLTPLESNFQVVATRTSSQMRSINNATETWVDYHLTLFPLKEGELEIPPLTVAGVQTQTMAVNVLPKTETTVAGQELFMEALASKESVYVQEQLLFTIRLYYTINGIRNPQFTELELPESVVQMIGTPNQYEKLVEGVRYGVYEKQYAIFPQRSGDLVIPDIMFRGEVTDGSSNYVFRNLNTRTITSFAAGHTVAVKEKPADYPADATWLPASELTISESWDNDFTNVRIGDAINRVIRIESKGLDGAALPPLAEPSIETVNIYSEPPSIDRTYLDGNIVGQRIESYSMVMTEAGTVRIPGVSIPWFDIDTAELKYATLEDTAIRIGALRSGGQQEVLQTFTDEPFDENSPGTLLTPDSNEENLITLPSTPLWIIVLAAALTALLLAVVYFSRRARTVKASPARKKVYPVAAPMYRQDIGKGAESAAFKELQRTAAQNHLPATRLAMIGWGRQYFADGGLHSLDDVAQRTGNPEIVVLCLRIQEALYGQESSADAKANVQKLLALVSALRTENTRVKTKAAKDQAYTLPPLYKA